MRKRIILFVPIAFFASISIILSSCSPVTTVGNGTRGTVKVTAGGADVTDWENVGDAHSAEEQEVPEMEVEQVSVQYGESHTLEELGYAGYQIKEITQQEVSSFRVSGGEKTNSLDDAVISYNEETENIKAVGTGSARIILSNTENEITVEMTVKPATLTLIFIAGQSNATGMCSVATGYQREQSVLCQSEKVFSSFAPTEYLDINASITGIEFAGSCVIGNVDEFIAGSLEWNTSINGTELAYPLGALTEIGQGKTGMDSGIAYEWNKLTGDCVWVVNAAYEASVISEWIPGGEKYGRAVAVFSAAYKTYTAEIEAGHYEAGNQFMAWLQGESDKDMGENEYLGKFNAMYTGFCTDLPYLDMIGVIMPRLSSDNEQNEEGIRMAGPRLALYSIFGNNGWNKLCLASNVNEQWVNDAGVSDYFIFKYGQEINLEDYPARSIIKTPTAVAEVHADIHYSQIAHNENGITAADGIYEALYGEN